MTVCEHPTEEWCDTLKRVVEGTFTIQKEHCLKYRLPWIPEKAQKTAQKMFELMWDFKFLPPGRGLWMMGTEYVKERGGCALNNPLHEDTKILTEEYGWVALKKIEGEHVHVLSSTHDYGSRASLLSSSSKAATPKWVGATISSAEEHPCVELTFEDRHGLETKIVSSLNHRWYRRKTSKKPWERVSAEELRVGDYAPIVKPTTNFKPCVTGYQHGFFFGDGTRSNGELHQFDSSVHVLNSLFGNRAEKIDGRHSVVRQCPLAWGELPAGSYLEDRRYVWSFLAGYVAADGSVDTNGNVYLHSSRLNELEQVVGLFRSLGIRCTDPIVSIPEGAPNNLVENRNALYKIRVEHFDLKQEFFLKAEHYASWVSNLGSRRRDWAQIKEIRRLNGTHRVLCAEVPGYEQFVVDGFILTSNCAFVSTKNVAEEAGRPFGFLMDVSMLGVGCGFDTRGAGFTYVYQPIGHHDWFHIPDTREGWVESVERLIDSYLLPDKPTVKFNYDSIRKEGEPINGFGGTASGPEPLRQLHEDLRVLLHDRINQTLESTHLVDMMNLIGKCVVAGNVRRTAEIAFGNSDDTEYLKMKLDKEKVMSHRWASNNSLFCEVGQDYFIPAMLTAENGEPGYQWMENARMFGRMKDPANFLDAEADGSNPCVEQTLWDKELCTLVETFPARHENFAEYRQTLKVAYLYAKTVTMMMTHIPETNRVMIKNRRIGTSMSGITRAFGKHGRRTLFNWADEGYAYLRQLDTVYSDWLGIPKSIKLTSVKPSGTVSLLPGEPPGIHYPHSEFYIRRVRFNKNHTLLDVLREAGYRVEPDEYSPSTTVVVEFPVVEKDFTKSKSDVTLWEQMENAAQMQHFWADNQVSCTVTFAEDEKKDIREALELYETRLKGISFLPLDTKFYPQMPYEEITARQYYETIKNIKPLQLTDVTQVGEGERYCDGDSCVL